MNRWLAVVLIVGALVASTQAAYPAISVGSTMLAAISKGQAAISAVGLTFYTAVNTIRTTLLTAAYAVTLNMNKTYTALATQFANNSNYASSIASALSTVASANMSISMTDSQAAMSIGSVVSALSQATQTQTDSWFSAYTTIGGSTYMGQNMTGFTNCVINNGSALNGANASLTRYSFCLGNETNAVNFLATIVTNFIANTNGEFNKATAQLKAICSPLATGTTSSDCTDAYFNSLTSEVQYTLGYLSVVPTLLTVIGQVVASTNQICISLTTADMSDLMMVVGQSIMGCSMIQ